MDMTVIRNGLEQAWDSAAVYTPKVLGALVIVLVGWVLATVLRTLARRVLDILRFDRAIHAAGVQTAAEQSGYDPKGLVAGVVYWFLLLLTFQMAADTLGATALSTSLSGLIGYLPQVLIAVAIVLIALAFSRFVAGAIRENTHSGVGAEIARWSIVGFGAFAALSQLQIAEPIVNALFYAMVATIGATVVVAFGVGGIPVARDVARRYVGRDDRSVHRAA